MWSPDGTKILFAADVAGQGEDLFVMDADGTGVVRLTGTPGDDGHPHWSADGTDLQQVTRCRSICTYGALSPDGARVAYRKVTSDPGFNWDMSPSTRNSEVFVARTDGSDERNLSRSAGFDGWPAWSPDGRWILFASNRGGRPLVGELFVAAPDGSAVHRISVSPESLVQPAWSADGRRILAAQYALDEQAASIVVMEAPATRMQ